MLFYIFPLFLFCAVVFTIYLLAITVREARNVVARQLSEPEKDDMQIRLVQRKRLPSGSPTSESPTWWAFLRWDFLSPSVIRKSHLNYYVFLHFHSLIWALGVMGHVYQGPSRVRTKKKL